MSFTEDEVASLNAYQLSDVGRPCVCAHCYAVLMAQSTGWSCPHCGDTDIRVLLWMKNWHWLKWSMPAHQKLPPEWLSKRRELWSQGELNR